MEITISIAKKDQNNKDKNSKILRTSVLHILN